MLVDIVETLDRSRLETKAARVVTSRLNSTNEEFNATQSRHLLSRLVTQRNQANYSRAYAKFKTPVVRINVHAPLSTDGNARV